MRKVMKRVCALFLALMMLMGTFSLNVFAGKIIEGTKEDKLYLSWKYYSFDKTSKTHTEVQALEEGILYCAQLVFSNNPTAADDTVTGADLWCQYDTAAVNIPNTGDNTSKSVFTSLPVTIAANNDGNGSLSVHIMTTSGIEEYGEIIESGVFFETHFTAQKAVAKTELPNLFQLTSKSTIFDVNEKDFTIVEAPAFIANAPSDATIYTSDTETDVAKKLTGTFIDASGTSMVVDVTSVTFENALTAGENVVTASYEYEGVTYTCDVTINVTADTLTKIEVTTQPKLKYFSGEALDLTGMVVTATYASNKTKELTGYTTEPEAGDKLTIAANNEKPVEVSYGGMTANTENLTVSAKIVEKPEATGTYIYDGTEQTFAITGGDCDYYTVEGRTSGTNAGSYEATASLNDTTETSWADNTKDNITLTWTIAPKAITPAIADISDQQYTGSQIKPEITVKDGETPLTKDVDYTVSYGDNIKVGENKGSVTVKAAENGNYTFSDVTAYFNIVAQAGSISITAKNAEYTGNAYAESNIEVSKNNATASVTFTYYTDANATEQTTTDSGAAYEGAAPKNAGTYYVKASMDASDNYSFAESTVASFTITKKALTITAEDKTITFGDAAPDYTFTGNGYVAGEDSSVINAAFDCTYKQGSNAGTYTITVTATAANYEISCNRGTLTVAKK